VFYNPPQSPVLGQNSMKDTGRYSVVCAIQNLWLMARAYNIGLGWVSILDPASVKESLGVPENHEMIGYLCLGYVKHFLDKPELEALEWKKRRDKRGSVHFETYQSSKHAKKLS
jgi:5,6-dimethylbenzimidazole synthase